jgi:hypothetical protein
MDSINLDQWRDVIEQVLLDYAAIPYSYSEVRKEAVFDRERDPSELGEANRYLVLAMGWEGYRYEHGCMIHVDIIEGKIWIQRDGTEDGVALDLENAGVPKERIVLGFKPPEVRPMTGYAVA